MKRFRTAAFFLLLAGNVFAQQMPHLAYVYPAGGRIGTTFQISVAGQFLMTVSNVFVTGLGISATVLDRDRPMNQKEFNELRDRLKVLQEKFQATRKGDAGTNVWTVADAVEREQIRAKILKNPPNRTANPAMIDRVSVRISIASDAAPGEREIRLATPNALSNPLRFCVGTLLEISKPAAKPANPDLDKYLERIGGRPAPAGTPKYESRISLPSIVNGQIMPGGVDRYLFFATAGQHLVIAVSARQLIPYLADAVPGWFESVLTIYDSKGKELASEERFRFKPDPVIHFEVPRAGEYTVEIHDSIFRGREDFVYRLAIGELPFVTGIFPLGGRLGEKTSVALTGWNLPVKSLLRDNTETGITSLNGAFFNIVPFAVDDLPECFEQKPSNSTGTAQAITLPIIINGRIGQPGERDVFTFQGHAGQRIVAEVFARRLDSPLDSFLRLTGAGGKQLAFNDDFEDKGSGLNTHHADSYLTATLPGDGTFFIQITDTQGQGGPEFAYRLRVSEPQPDFALRVVPSSISLRTGMSAPLTVFALRRDGFTNAIHLELETAPEGFSLSGARVLGNQDKAQFTLKAPPESFENPVAISLEGDAFIAGKLVTHAAVPAEDMMQAFAYRHLVPSKELAVTVSGPPRLFARDAFKITSETPVRIPLGGTASVRIATPSGAFANRFCLELNEAPEGIAIESVSPAGSGVEIVLRCDAAKAKPGLQGNLIFDILPKVQPAAQPAQKPGNQRRNPAGTLPAIPFEISAE